jgi:uncharacterized LabA/DUF88 family protein
VGKNFTYVDNSNVYIEGCRASAVRKGMPGAATIVEAMNKKVVDPSWQLDYGALHAFACGDPAEIGAANLWGSPPPGDSFWQMVERHKFKVTKYDLNAARKEKKVDVAIAHRMTKDAYSGVVRKGEDEMTLVAGDKDYVPMVEDLVANGFIIHVVFWDHAASELKSAASKFIGLNPHLDFLTRKWLTTKSSSMPRRMA